MKIELHMLQNVPPANLNRDDTGEPKSAMFGGVLRARVSSQCWKRAIRLDMRQQLGEEMRATRTLKVGQLLGDRLIARGRAEPESLLAATRVFEAVSIINDKGKGKGKAAALAFIGHDEIDRLADLVEANWETLTSEKGMDKKEEKVFENAVKDALGESSAVDLALFGRMIATMPGKNVDGALQVAHAISTNRLDAERDWFTALDDLATKEETGAAMIESTGYNSSCFYRYMTLDADALVKRLGREDARTALKVFLDSAIIAMPTGKRTSTAPNSRPSLVLAVVRDDAALSLANAFDQPVRGGQEGLVANSIKALDKYWGRIVEIYGDEGIKAVAVSSLASDNLDVLAPRIVPSVTALVDLVIKAAFEPAGKGNGETT